MGHGCFTGVSFHSSVVRTDGSWNYPGNGHGRFRGCDPRRNCYCPANCNRPNSGGNDERLRRVFHSAASSGSLSRHRGASRFQEDRANGNRAARGRSASYRYLASVGQLAETVAVEEVTPLVNTDSATLGNVVDNKKVTELPLNGRNFLQMNLLVPGANQGVKGSQNQTQGGSISVNGAREQSNNFLLDGMDNNDQAINQYAVAISTEAIQEFKVQASTYSAEFGRSPGAQINVATKAGTNAYHGVLYEYFRNSALDAKNFFDRPGPIPEYRRNQYGVSVGGPIKKDKTFFFANYEGNRIRQGITKVAPVPTTAMKNGDFSALPTTIYDHLLCIA